jgi:hypothetical protein
MIELPELVTRALLVHTSSPALTGLRTAASHPVGDLGAPPVLLTLWCVITDDRAWVIGADESHAVVWGVGQDDGVRLERGWVTDTLIVGRHELPLRAGSRRPATALVEAWTATSKGGPAVAPATEPTPPPDRTRSAAAAVGLPEWWSAQVPAPNTARWLFALETASSSAFPRWTGQPYTASVWVGFSDQHAMIAAWDPDTSHLRCRELNRALGRATGATRAWLDIGDTQLGAPRLAPAWLKLAVDLSEADPETRWSLLAEHHLDQSDPASAISAWEEALHLGRARRCWPGIARLAWAAVDTPRAHRALTWALLDGTAHAGERSAWAAPLRWRARSLPHPQEVGALISDLLGSAIEALEVPERPAVFPDPAATEIELWVGALAAARRWSQADDTARALPEDGRGREVLAALRTAQGHATAPQLWVHAARTWRNGKHAAAARRCIERSIELEPTPAAAWLAASWAGEDLQPARRDRYLQAAIAADPDGLLVEDEQLDLATWRATIALASSTHQRLTARALRRVITLAPEDMESRWQLAEVLAGPLGRPDDAVEVLRTIAALQDRGIDPAGRDPGAAWRRIASLSTGEAQEQALREAATRDFLRAEALVRDAALASTDQRPDLADWWLHLARLLGGNALSDAPAPGPVPIGAADVDRLHPGGHDWLARLRLALDPKTPPARSELVRGLGPLRETSETAHAVLEEVCHLMGLPVVDAFVYRGDHAWGAAAWPTKPPVLLVGHAHLLPGPRHLQPAELRFLLAVELAHLRCQHPLVGLDDGLIGTSRSMYAALGRYAGPAESLVDLLLLVPGLDQLTQLERAARIGRSVLAARGTLDKLSDIAAPVLSWLGPESAHATGIGREGLGGQALQLRLHADRVALLATGDLHAAVAAMLRASTSSLSQVERLETEGLAALLQDTAHPLSPDEVLRITALVGFAAARGPFGAWGARAQAAPAAP